MEQGFFSRARQEFVRDYEKVFCKDTPPSIPERVKFIDRWEGYMKFKQPDFTFDADTIIGTAHQVYLKEKDRSSS